MNEEVSNALKTSKRTGEKATAFEVPEKLKAVAYIGPSLKLIVQNGTVFKNGFPPKLAAVIMQHPFLNGLMIPVSNLASAKKELQIPGGSLQVLYQEAEKLAGGKTNV